MSSLLGKVFGKKDNTPSTAEAIDKLRDTEDMLQKKQVVKFPDSFHPVNITL